AGGVGGTVLVGLLPARLPWNVALLISCSPLLLTFAVAPNAHGASPPRGRRRADTLRAPGRRLRDLRADDSWRIPGLRRRDRRRVDVFDARAIRAPASRPSRIRTRPPRHRGTPADRAGHRRRRLAAPVCRARRSQQ